MPRLPFAKVQGLGNDFLVVDLREGKPGAAVRPSPVEPDVARRLCDRHFGVGADGVLAVVPGTDGRPRMRVINADGSEAEMCGNGIRCVAKVLYETDPALRKPVIDIETGAGLLSCAVQAVGDKVRSVAVSMGRPRLRRSEIPMTATGPAEERVIRTPVEANGRTFLVTAVSMGNPHAVIFIDDPEADLRAWAEMHGPHLETHPLFPRRTNVEFARVRQGRSGVEIDLVVWERGCGITLACGTGACATAVAACLEGRAATSQDIPVHLPGGALSIHVTPDAQGPEAASFAQVTMRGPAELVFEAELDLSVFLSPGSAPAAGRHGA